MKKEVGYIILCQCYPFVRGRRTHFILLRRLLSKPIPIRRMIEGRIPKITGFLRRQWCIIQKKMVHYDSMKFQCFYSGKDDSINSMEEGMNLADAFFPNPFSSSTGHSRKTPSFNVLPFFMCSSFSVPSV